MQEAGKHTLLVVGGDGPFGELAMCNPLVSIVIPAYNADGFIAKTLNSAIAQTYQNLEILVIDDGSRDRTVKVVEAIAISDSRIKLFRQPNGGVAAARNLGIRVAKGEFIAPIDADDLWHPKAVEKLVGKFKKSSNKTGVVYAWSVDIDEQGEATGNFHAAVIDGDVYKTLICHNFLGNASSTLIRTACFDQIGGYSTQLKAKGAQGCEDWDLYLRLAERFDFAVVPEFLIGYRKISKSMSQDFAQMARSQQLMLQAIQGKHPEIPGYLYRVSRSSFYLYLAQQSNKYSSPQTTLSWLRQAVKVEPMTSLSRLGTYSLLFQSFAKQFWNSWASPGHNAAKVSTAEINKTNLPRKPSNQSSAPDRFNPAVIDGAKVYRPKIWLKVLVGTLLHYVLERT